MGWLGAADGYARALWRVLALVFVPGSIHYIVLPGWHRDDLLADAKPDHDLVGTEDAWWRPVGHSQRQQRDCSAGGGWRC